MTLNNEITNSIAGGVWLALGVGGTLWLGRCLRLLRREYGQGRGVWWVYTSAPDSPARQAARALTIRMWAAFAAWLTLYLVLDWWF